MDDDKNLITGTQEDDSQIIIQKSHNLSPEQIMLLRKMLTELFGQQGILRREQEMDIRVKSGTNVFAIQNINIDGQNITNASTEIVNPSTDFYSSALDEVLRIGFSALRERIYKHAVKRQGSQAAAARLLGVARLTIFNAMKRMREKEK